MIPGFSRVKGSLREIEIMGLVIGPLCAIPFAVAVADCWFAMVVVNIPPLRALLMIRD
jgi:hypothetical protein